MSGSDGPNSTNVPPVQDYEWRYEYYDEEPVSFEGLRVHRYSIVISFWVGLAVVVIFMFFLLTLLTKTGAPYPDSGQPCEKRCHLTGYMDSNPDKAARPLHSSGPGSSRPLFQCYASRDIRGSCSALWTTVGGVGGGGGAGCHRRPGGGPDDATLLQELVVTGDRTEKEAVLLAHFNIPNFVNSEQSSAAGEDDLLLLGEPGLPVIVEGMDQSSLIRKQDNHSDFT